MSRLLRDLVTARQDRGAVAVSRRATLLGLASAFTLGRARLALARAASEQRVVVVILRGALDGLSAVAPYGDPNLAPLRGKLLLPPPNQPDGLLELGGFYGLHPAMPSLHNMYASGEALLVHAVAGPYRDRSHFHAQDFMESGADHRLDSGWLGRAAQITLRGVDRPAQQHPLAVGMSVPLLLRGPLVADNWAPAKLPAPRAALYARIMELNHGDPLTGPAIESGLRGRGFSAAVLAGKQPERGSLPFLVMAKAAGEMLAAADGPRIAALELDGWDTHAGQLGRLPPLLHQLDDGLAAMKAALGPAWRQTAVLVMTEFGRTARINGTGGTDHGTATVAFVLGGAVAGGRVVADWPGLAPDRLFEDRDLAPTTDLRAVAKGILAQHLGLDRAGLAQVFPGGDAVEPVRGLIRA